MRSLGGLVAAALACSWRARPPALDLSAAELAAITPILLESGGAALAWRRARASARLRATPAAAELQQAYRLHTLQAALHERNIKAVLALLRAAGVEPLLVKGWAAARLYAEPGARPYGDIDLCVDPEQYQTACAVLREAGDKYPVDLHNGTGMEDGRRWQGTRMLDDRGWDELFARSRLIPLDATQVRVPSAEDHLRILCFHLLRHGVERPSGLCDIAASVEARPPDFDWSVCLGTHPVRADWIACAVGLAGRLLGARTDDTPVAARAATLPEWLLRAVLARWAVSFAGHFTRDGEMGMSHHLRRPAGFVRAVARRWPTPILGTVGVGGSFNNLPRFPYQLGYFLRRFGWFLRGLSASDAR